MLSTLMRSRRFAPLFWCQFFSAFNDNFLKTSLVFLILFKMSGPNSEALITTAGAVFILPYFILSALGGEIADRFDKAFVAERLKLIEILVAGLAVIGFRLDSVPVLFVALFLFGVIGALFGPIKYGILPDHLAEAELPAGNALVEGATFIAILLGTIVGGLAAKDGGNPGSFGSLIMAFAFMCWISARFIPATGEAAPDLKIERNIARSTFDLLRELKAQRRLWWGGLVVSWFWLVGVLAMSLLPPLARNILGGDEQVVTVFLAIFSTAIAVGSGLASWLASGRIILIPTAFGALLVGAFALDIGADFPDRRRKRASGAHERFGIPMTGARGGHPQLLLLTPLSAHDRTDTFKPHPLLPGVRSFIDREINNLSATDQIFEWHITDLRQDAAVG